MFAKMLHFAENHLDPTEEAKLRSALGNIQEIRDISVFFDDADAFELGVHTESVGASLRIALIRCRN